MKKFRYITIEREYGSGGTEIARLTSEKSGVPYYGLDILRRTADALRTTVGRIQKYEEKVTNKVMFSIFAMGKANSGDGSMLTAEDRIYVTGLSVVQDFAKQGKAIFLGHCASEALKEHSGVVKVFIRADRDDKKRRIITEYGIEESAAAGTAKRYDKKRANFYFANTGKQWNDMRNYDIVLDSSALGVESCADMLAELLRSDRT